MPVDASTHPQSCASVTPERQSEAKPRVQQRIATQVNLGKAVHRLLEGVYHLADWSTYDEVRLPNDDLDAVVACYSLECLEYGHCRTLSDALRAPWARACRVSHALGLLAAWGVSQSPMSTAHQHQRRHAMDNAPLPSPEETDQPCCCSSLALGVWTVAVISVYFILARRSDK